MSVDTNETAELALVGSKAGQTIIVTHHFRNTEIGVGHTLQELIDEWQAACQASWLAVLTNAYTLTKVVGRHVCGSLPLDATVEETVGLTGTRASSTEGLAPWMAMVVRERTASAGRSRRGRFFVPLNEEGDVVADAVVAGQVTLVQTYCTNLAGKFISGAGVSAAWRLVVHSRKLASVPGTECQNSSTLVTSLAVQTALTTQRSRRSRPA